MHENEKRTAGTLPELRKNLEYIPVCSDPRGVQMSRMHAEGAIIKEIHIRIEQQSTLFEMMGKTGRLIAIAACVGMVYMLVRIAVGIPI